MMTIVSVCARAKLSFQVVFFLFSVCILCPKVEAIEAKPPGDVELQRTRAPKAFERSLYLLQFYRMCISETRVRAPCILGTGSAFSSAFVCVHFPLRCFGFILFHLIVFSSSLYCFRRIDNEFLQCTCLVNICTPCTVHLKVLFFPAFANYFLAEDRERE